MAINLRKHPYYDTLLAMGLRYHPTADFLPREGSTCPTPFRNDYTLRPVVIGKDREEYENPKNPETTIKTIFPAGRWVLQRLDLLNNPLVLEAPNQMNWRCFAPHEIGKRLGFDEADGALWFLKQPE